MKKLILLFFIIQSCSINNWIKYNPNNEIEIVINDVNVTNKKHFYDSNLYTIYFDTISNVNQYTVYNDEFLIGLSVVPDTISIYFNDFKELDGKLFLFHSNNVKYKNSDIFKKIDEYGVELDSCLYKFKYLNNSPIELTECTLDNKGNNFHPKYLIFSFKKSKSGKNKYLKQEKW